MSEPLSRRPASYLSTRNCLHVLTLLLLTHPVPVSARAGIIDPPAAQAATQASAPPAGQGPSAGPKDAGRGQVTGLRADLGRFKTPTMRALAARPPYFHNGISPTLDAVVRHYERFLGFSFTDEERADLVAFLNAL